MMRASRYTDEAYLFHPRAAALHYEPLPTDTITVECADCPPCPVRNVNAPRRDRPPRHEQRYGRRGYGPTNASGRAKS